MLLGFEDKSGANFVFAIESIVAVTPHPTQGEHCRVYFGHLGGLPIEMHYTPVEFLNKIGEAMNAVQGRANLLGLAGRAKQ